MKINFLILLISVFADGFIQANSFVGNGGNAGDVELSITKNQILQSFQIISNSPESLYECECLSNFANRKECEPLADLNLKQKKYCASQIKNVSQDIILLLGNGKLEIQWTDKSIFVKDNNKVVTADAVANSSDMSITLNKKVFLSLPHTQRIFLLTHELLHLVPINKTFLSDTGKIGPFEGVQGQRELLNSMASEIVMRTHRYGLFRKYNPSLMRGQSHNTNWLDFDILQLKALEKNDNSFSNDSHSGIRLSYKKFYGKFGVNLGMSILKSTKGLLQSIDVDENLNIYNLGLSYRVSMGNDPLTAYGQSFINFDLNLDLLDSRLELSDASVSGKSKDTGLGVSANAKYYYPLNPFWITFGLGLAQHSYEHELVDLKINGLKLSGNIGVSYGF